MCLNVLTKCGSESLERNVSVVACHTTASCHNLQTKAATYLSCALRSFSTMSVTTPPSLITLSILVSSPPPAISLFLSSSPSPSPRHELLSVSSEFTAKLLKPTNKSIPLSKFEPSLTQFLFLAKRNDAQEAQARNAQPCGHDRNVNPRESSRYSCDSFFLSSLVSPRKAIRRRVIVQR
ncbi:hypothetical protein Mapa_001379 [Marchantia paleacea]|nr:hypothetical protein Mapa_001379 [Marchantia paleacea]